MTNPMAESNCLMCGIPFLCRADSPRIVCLGCLEDWDDGEEKREHALELARKERGQKRLEAMATAVHYAKIRRNSAVRLGERPLRTESHNTKTLQDLTPTKFAIELERILKGEIPKV